MRLARPGLLAFSTALIGVSFLVAPGAALGASAGLFDDPEGGGKIFFFEAEPGEANLISIRRDSFTSTYTLYDSGAEVTPVGCTGGSDGHGVTCPAADVAAVQIELGDGNDQVVEFSDIAGPTPAVTFGGPGDDRLIAGRGENELYGEEGSDSLRGNVSEDYLDGGEDDDSGSAGNSNTVNGSFIAGLEGRGANDTIDGGPGDDLLRETDETQGAGDDDIFGGTGFDTVTYQDRGEDVAVTLEGDPGDGEADENDNVAPDVEEVYGGYGNDLLVGNDQPNILNGWPGDDTIIGNAGGDVLRGDPSAIGQGDDTVLARDGEVDAISCADGIDFVEADAAENFVAPFGCDVVDSPGATPPGGGGGAAGNAATTAALVRLAVTSDVLDFARAAARGGARRLARKGAFAATADVPTAGLFQVKATLVGKAAASTVIAKGSKAFAGKASQKVKVKLTKKGKRILRSVRRRARLKVTVSFKPAGGAKASRSKTLKLRR